MQTSTKGSFVAVWNRETNKKVGMIRCELQNGKTKGNKSGVPRNKMSLTNCFLRCAVDSNIQS